jgi:hypothetical protein
MDDDKKHVSSDGRCLVDRGERRPLLLAELQPTPASIGTKQLSIQLITTDEFTTVTVFNHLELSQAP